MTKTNLTEATKKRVAAKQHFKCANKPGSKSRGLDGYKCELWEFRDGTFGESLYEIDHIEEYCISHNNDISNLQALCPGCHAVKTKRFMAEWSKSAAKIKGFESEDDETESNESENESEPEFKICDSESDSEGEIEDNREIFASNYDNTRKIRRFTIVKIYTCNECNETFNDERNYENHLNNEYKCKTCNPDRINFKYTCERCKKGFNRKQLYDTHINRKYKCEKVREPEVIAPTIKMINKYICIGCKEEFHNSSNLSRHRNGHCKSPTVPIVHQDKFKLIMETIDELKKENLMLQKKVDGIRLDYTNL
jgi:hypothetical protein